MLQRLIEHGLTLDINKYEFESKSTKYLRDIIEVSEGIHMDPEKLKAIEEWQCPLTVKGVRSFLEFTNYYCLFISSYSGIAKPLTNLTKKDTPFV